MTVIYFNGKAYNNLDEMPADQRAAYEQMMSFMKDENHNGLPDMLEGDLVQKLMKLASTSVMVNGQEVQRLETLPPEARAKYEQAMARLGQLGIAVPGMPAQTSMQPTPQIAPSEPAFPQSSSFQQSPSFPQDSPSVISEDGESRTGLIIAAVAALAVLFLCALAVAGYLLFNH